MKPNRKEDFDEQVDPNMHDANTRDPILEEKLVLLMPVPPRDPTAAGRTQARFLAELDELALPENARAASLSGFFHWLFNGKKENKMNNPNRSFYLRTAAVILLIVAFLFGGTGMTAMASQSALPGDTLYPVKTSLERTQLNLSGDAASRAQLEMDFAERRLDEISALIAEGRLRNVAQPAQAFETHIQTALAEIAAIAQGDPTRAAEVLAQITQSLSRYTQTLNTMVSSAPEPAQSELRRALNTAQNAGSNAPMQGEVEFSGVVELISPTQWMVSGRPVEITPQTEIKGTIAVGERVKVHGSANTQSKFVAREIERLGLGDDDNSNRNSNSNQNGSDDDDNSNRNSNFNQNSSDDDNSNLNSNSNQNSSDDDDDRGINNQNSNTNLNGNTNQNSNDDSSGSGSGVNNNDDHDDDSSGSGSDSNNNDDHDDDSSGSGSGSNNNDDDD